MCTSKTPSAGGKHRARYYTATRPTPSLPSPKEWRVPISDYLRKWTSGDWTLDHLDTFWKSGLRDSTIQVTLCWLLPTKLDFDWSLIGPGDKEILFAWTVLVSITQSTANNLAGITFHHAFAILAIPDKSLFCYFPWRREQEEKIGRRKKKRKKKKDMVPGPSSAKPSTYTI